jgi:hypothetical protein
MGLSFYFAQPLEEKAMKSFRMILIAVLAGGLLLASLVACGGGAVDTPVSQTEPTQPAAPAATEPIEAQPTQAPEPTQTPEPTVAPTETSTAESTEAMGLDPSTLSTAGNLNSYRSKMTITTTGTRNGENIEETIDMSIEYTKEPPAEHVVMSGTAFNQGEAPGSLEMYQVGGSMYLKMGDQWLSIPASEGDQISQAIITPEQVLQDTCGWKKGQNTEIGGVPVQHFTTSKQQIESCAPLNLFGDTGILTDAGGDVYIATDENYVAQMDLFYEGTGLDLNLGGTDEAVDQGRMDFHFEMTDVNQPISIQVPEEAIQAGSLPEDIPVPADAEEVSNMFGMITFQSASSPQDIANYYKAEMPKNGWTQGSDENLGGVFMLEFTKDTRTASFMISTDTNTNKTSVVITVQEEGQ